MKAITSFNELMSKLNEAEEAQATSDDPFRRSLASWYFSPSLIDECPHDPYSDEYQAFQLEFYQRLANDVYSPSKEKVDLNFEHEIQWPYPYGTKSAATVGAHLMGYGWLIRKMDLSLLSLMIRSWSLIPGAFG